MTPPIERCFDEVSNGLVMISVNEALCRAVLDLYLALFWGHLVSKRASIGRLKSRHSPWQPWTSMQNCWTAVGSLSPSLWTWPSESWRKNWRCGSGGRFGACCLFLVHDPGLQANQVQPFSHVGRSPLKQLSSNWDQVGSSVSIHLMEFKWSAWHRASRQK